MDNRILEKYQSMLKTIDEFEVGDILIDALIARFEILMNAVSNGDEVWKDDVLQNWATLEMARAIALFEGRAFLNEHETQKVVEALAELKRLVHEKIGSCQVE